VVKIKNSIFKKWWYRFFIIFFLCSIGCFYLSDFYDSIETEETTKLKPTYIETNEIVVYSEEDQEMVWISYSGEKYHSNPNCSNMKNPNKISKADAVNRGRTPCSKCY